MVVYCYDTGLLRDGSTLLGRAEEIWGRDKLEKFLAETGPINDFNCAGLAESYYLFMMVFVIKFYTLVSFRILTVHWLCLR